MPLPDPPVHGDSRAPGHRTRILLKAAVLAIAGVAVAVAAPTVQDFDNPGTNFAITNTASPNPGPGPAIIGPDANSTGLFQRFLQGGFFARHMNAVAYDLTEPGPAGAIHAEFDFRLTCAGARSGFSGGGCADGFSFMFLDTETFGTSGPGPLVDEAVRTRDPNDWTSSVPNKAFGIGFLIFDHPSIPTPDNQLWLRFAGKTIIRKNIDPNVLDLATGTFGVTQEFLHASIDLILEGSPSLTMSITNPVTGVTVIPFDDLDLSGVEGIGPYESRVFYGGRCGDACALYDIDNIDVAYTPAGPTNSPPSAVDDAVVTDEDTPVTFDVLGNDSDPDGDPLTASATSAPANGALVDNGGGSFIYTPALNFNGADSFTYEVDDGNGGTAGATVNLTINPVNDAPVAVDDSATTAPRTSVVIDVLANDSDVDGDTLGVIAVTQGNYGSVGINADDTVTYSPVSIDDLMAQVQALPGLNGGQKNALLAKLRAAKRSLDRGNPEAAAGQLGAFKNQVRAFERTGKIDSATADRLVALADAVLNPPSSDSFEYTVGDGNGGVDTAIVTVTIS